MDITRKALTEMRSAIPVQSPPALEPKKDRIPNDARAPSGVDALKNAMCFLHSERAKDVESRDMDKARAVGAYSRNMLSVQVLLRGIQTQGNGAYLCEL